MARKSIIVDIGPYVSSHCSTPRGRGGWIFAYGPIDNNDWRNFNGTFIEAKRQAVKVAKEYGVEEIHVLP